MSPACPEETRAGLLKLLKDYAGNGANWAADALTLQPCQMWEAIRGRTVWFVGDSISQVADLGIRTEGFLWFVWDGALMCACIPGSRTTCLPGAACCL